MKKERDPSWVPFFVACFTQSRKAAKLFGFSSSTLSARRNSNAKGAEPLCESVIYAKCSGLMLDAKGAKGQRGAERCTELIEVPRCESGARRDKIFRQD